MGKTEKKWTAALLSAAIVISGLFIPSNTDAAASDTLKQSDFLKASGKEVRTEYGEGEIVQLKGTNAGGYLVQEPWMSTLQVTGGVVAEMDMYEKLTERFGEEKMRNIVETYRRQY